MDIEALILEQIRFFGDWVSVADVLKGMGTTSFVAGRDDVRRVLEGIDSSGRLRLGRVGTIFVEVPKPLPVDTLVDRIFGEGDASDRSAAMMELFIDGS